MLLPRYFLTHVSSKYISYLTLLYEARERQQRTNIFQVPFRLVAETVTKPRLWNRNGTVASYRLQALCREREPLTDILASNLLRANGAQNDLDDRPFHCLRFRGCFLLLSSPPLIFEQQIARGKAWPVPS